MTAEHGLSVATTAVAAGVFGLGLLVGAPAASAVTSTDFTTPLYGMDCSTSQSGSFGSYSGHATCTGGTAGVGLWYVKVDCTAGGTYSDPIHWEVPGPGAYTTSTAVPACTFGINSIQVVERTR
jgi:hypothetical protein